MKFSSKYMPPDEVKKIKEEVLKREKPRREDYEKAYNIYREIKRKIEKGLKENNVEGEVVMVGSIAKDTWLKGDRDLDIFVLFDPSLGKDFIEKEGFEIIKKYAPKPFEEQYAEHPYIRAEIKGFEVDIVPCFKVDEPSKIISAVDRTPFHTRYVLDHMKEQQKDEVRVLKRFLKGIEAYGAEIKIEGFSGYLAELLILNYGTFENCLMEVTKWRPWKIVIDIEGYWNPKEAIRKFKSPLIVIDPVDPNRNAAAAVSLQKLSEFISAARFFLKRPTIKMFYPPDIGKISREEIEHILKERETDIIIVSFKPPRLPPDILWGQLKRSLKAIRKLLEIWDFKIIDAYTWSNDRDKAFFAFELERVELPIMKKHVGPPIVKEENEEMFIRKYISNEKVLAGPRIEGSRWVVFIKRKHKHAKELLLKRIWEAGVSKDIMQALKGSMEVLVNQEVSKLLIDEEYSKALARFISKIPRWLLAVHEGEGRCT